MTTKAIIFDMDGTIADTEEIHRLAFNAAFAEYNLDWRWDFKTYKDLLSISGGRERILHCLDKETKTHTSKNNRQLARKIHQRKSALYRELLENENIQCRTGVLRLLEEAKTKGINLAIATSSSRANVETLLNNVIGTDGIGYFDSIISSDVVDDKKPCPIVYKMALSGLGYEAENCIAIEDTSNGNTAAVNAGLSTIITTHQYTTDSKFTDASLVVDSLGDIANPFLVDAGLSFGKEYVDLELIEAILDCPKSDLTDTWRRAANAN